MSTFVRTSSRVARLSRTYLDASHNPARTRPLPTSLTSRYPWGHPRCRNYATVEPDQHKDAKQGKSNDAKGDGKMAKKASGKPAPGFEQTYNPSSPLSGGQPSPQPDGKEPEKKPVLTQAEEKRIEELEKFMKDSTPAFYHNEIAKAISVLKKNGIPNDLKEVMDDIDAAVKEGKVPPIRKNIKITTIFSRLSKDADDAGTTAEGAGQKSGAHDPGPGRQSKKGNKTEQPSMMGLKFDAMDFFRAAVVAYILYMLLVPGDNTREITWQEFKNTFLDKGLVEKIVVTDKKTAKVYLHRQAVAAMYPDSQASQNNFYYYFNLGSIESFERRMDEAQRDLNISSKDRIPVAYHDATPWGGILLNLAPTLAFVALFVFLMRRAQGGGGGSSGGIFGMGRSRAKRFNHESEVKVKFGDVAGMDEAKQEIMEFVSFLKDPGVYQKLGAKIPRGAILSGPPGTGKTLLAKATAGESGVPFFSVSGSEFVEMFVGVGPSRVRDLFATARKNTPCIIFIDEIDAIGRARSKNNISGGNDERESTLNQILTEMDGFNTSEQVVVIAGTNRPDILDNALLRPGRFDRHISIDKPTMEGRKQIFAVHLKKIVTHEEQNHLQGRLAALTPGFSGADIANCVNEAALIAARNKAESVEMTHFEQAIERVIGGLEKKSLVLSPEEKRVVAYHEAGHAICGWYFKWADPLLKVSIIPRGQGALGYAQYLPQGDAYLMNVNQLMDRMAMTLGGRVSEELHFDTVTSGASDDFKKVTRMASAMVTKFGMSKKIGYLHYEDETGQQQFQKPFSEETARNIDSEVRRIVDDAYKQCKDLLTERKEQVGLVAEELLKKEALVREDLIRLLGPRPWGDNEEFSKYFNGSQRGDREGPGSGIAPDPQPPMPTPGPEPSPASSRLDDGIVR